MAHSRSSSKDGPHVFTNIPFVNYSSITDPCGGDGLERWCGLTYYGCIDCLCYTPTLTLTLPLTP